ncbi:ankyrin repeat domain-containing protein [Rhodoferax sp.]|jgi:hypothetical protein|uniref:ankyrin repeat domain-containing protein n=1 Tax=Rhodoferax sp. TaxID=50421 RepID=UPI00378363D6
MQHMNGGRNYGPVSFMRAKSAKSLLAAWICLVPMIGGCEMADPNEFRLNTSSVTEVFGTGVQRELARAAAKGDTAQIKRLIEEKKADPNGEGNETITPVFWAMFAKNYAGLQTLLELGGDPNKPMWLSAGKNLPKSERWALIQAATWEDLQMMEILLKAGANPNIGNKRVSALHRVAHNIEAVKLLVKYGADVNQTTVTGGVAMAMFGNLDTIIFVLEKGYHHELDGLMYQVLEHYPSTIPGRAEQQEKILAMLRAKGIKPLVPPCVIEKTCKAPKVME